MGLELVSSSCDLCSGTGWITSDGTNAVACRCQKEQRKTNRVSAAAIPKRYLECSLQNFHDRGNARLKTARREIAEFVDCWPSVDRGLILMGPCGVGKTHLAVAALLEIIRSDKPGKLLFRNFQDLIHEIQASFSSDQVPKKSELLEPMLEADLLVLDELGSQKPTLFVQDILYYVINTRYNEERATIFTTNFLDESQAGIESLQQRIGERLRSRIYAMAESVVIDSDDYRKSVQARRV